MNINELPEEILVRILSFLSRSDRLEGALTCRRWTQTLAQAPPLLRDIWLVIGQLRMEEAETVFAKSQRQYENLRLDTVTSLEFNTAFWTGVGPGLRKLELVECEWSHGVFYSILQACSSLESLKICRRYGSSQPVYNLTESSPGMYLERIQRSMRNLRHLDLEFRLTADVLEHLFILMPNVTSIALSNFNGKSDVLSRLPNTLRTSRKITALCLDEKLVGHNECEQLLRISSASLRTLKYFGSFPGATALVLRNCSMLRDLNLSLGYIRDTRLVQKILRNVPELESLSIGGVPWEVPFRREDLTPIFEFRKLRKLALNLHLMAGKGTHVPDEIVANLSQMISLESLTVGCNLGIVDGARFRVLASMPNLRELVVKCLVWDAECLRTVLFDLRKLRTLDICGHDTRDDRPVPHYRDSELERNILSPQDRQEEHNLSSLEVFITYGIPFTNAYLGRFAAHHSRLKIAHFSGCYDITDDGLVTLCQHVPLLEELKLSSRKHRLKGTFVESLGKLCRRLRSCRVYVIWGVRGWARWEWQGPRGTYRFW